MLPHFAYMSTKLCPTKGQREKLWRKFFLDPSQWWDHRSEKVTEHKSCQSSYVNGAIALVGVNVAALSRLKVGAALGFKVYSDSIYV